MSNFGPGIISINNINAFSIILNSQPNKLLFPDINYLVKFSNGDLGIADSIHKTTILNNMNFCTNPSQLSLFADSSGAKFSKSIESYFKSGKAQIPANDLTLDGSQNLMGMKALEKSTIHSIFKSQCPWMEIIQIMVGELIKIEDIIARTLALLAPSVIPAENPLALGYKSGGISQLLSQLSSLNNYTRISPTSSVTGTGSYEIVSTIYSTGEFNPSIDYTYKYINLPDTSIDISQLNSNTIESNSSSDPYANIRPTTVVFGIYDNKGNPISPPTWLINSGKWFGQFPMLSGQSYIWEKPGYGDYIGTSPPDNTGGWNYKTYISGELVGEPILYFSNVQTETILNYYSNYILDSLQFSGITGSMESSIYNQIYSQISSNDNINNILQNEEIYGFLPSLKLSGGGTSPISKSPLAPNKILISSTQSMWVNPESDYDMKIIKCDSTQNITYTNSNGTQSISTQIIRFIKNTLSLSFSDSEQFNATIYINGSASNVYKDISTFYIDNTDISNDYTIDISINNFPSNLIGGVFNIVGGKIGELIRVQTVNQLKYQQYSISNLNTTGQISGNISIQNDPNGVIGIYFQNGTIVSWYTSQTNFTTTPPGDWALSNFQLNVTYWNATTNSYSYYLINGQNILEFTSSPIQIPDSLPPSITIMLPDGSSFDVNNGIATNYIILKSFDLKGYLPKNVNTESQLTLDNITFNISQKTINIPPDQIRVQSSGNPFGAIIDSSQITNSQLEINTPYSDGYYGSCYDNQVQTLAQIYRYMTYANDTQTYYLIEGIFTDKNNQGLTSSTTSVNNYSTGNSLASQLQNGALNYVYHKPQSLGSVKDFIQLLIDIFVKLIPQIDELENLITNPSSFITESILSQIKNDFLIFSDSLSSQFQNLKSQPSSQRESIVKNSQLSNFVFIDSKGNPQSIMDGISLLSILPIQFGLSFEKMVAGTILPGKQVPQTDSPLWLTKPTNQPQQPILGFILNLVSLPFEMLKQMLDYIKNLFSNLNLSQLSKNIEDFFTFKWVTKIFDPSNILSLAGIKLDLNTLYDWIKNINNYPDNKEFDLSSVINIPFLQTPPTVNKSQLKNIFDSIPKMLSSILNLFQSFINAFVDFIWALFGLKGIIPEPYLNLINYLSIQSPGYTLLNVPQNMTPQELQGILQGNSNTILSGTSSTNFTYQIQLPDGTIQKGLSFDEVQEFIKENGNITFYFD